MQIRRRHWVVALATAAVVHGAVAVAFLWEPPESGAKLVGMSGIEVSLGPAGGAPGEQAPAVPEVPEAPATEVPEAQAQPVAPPEVPVAEAPPTEAPPVETVEAEPPPEPAEVETVEVEPPPEPPVEVEVAAAPVTPPPPETAPVEPRPRRTPEASQPVASPPAEATKVAAAAPVTPGSAGRAGNRDREEAGSADASSGGGRPGVTADYAAVLQAWLEKHKEYPRRARRRRQEGAALLYFVMDREGHVLDYRIQESSGFRLLDREVERMIERAQPLPRMPEEMQQARLELVVPVQFFLR